MEWPPSSPGRAADRVLNGQTFVQLPCRSPPLLILRGVYSRMKFLLSPSSLWLFGHGRMHCWCAVLHGEPLTQPGQVARSGCDWDLSFLAGPLDPPPLAYLHPPSGGAALA